MLHHDIFTLLVTDIGLTIRITAVVEPTAAAGGFTILGAGLGTQVTCSGFTIEHRAHCFGHAAAIQTGPAQIPLVRE